MCSTFSDTVLTSGRSSSRVLLVAVLLAGFNFRTIFASLPPLLHDIRADLGLSAGVAGLLTTGPVVCFGVFALLAPELGRRLPIERLIAATVALTAVATALRSVGGVGGLFAATIVAGIAIAIGQALVPILARVREPGRTGVLTGAFSMTITAGAAVAAGSTVPLEHALGGWRGALALWAIPTACAVGVWAMPAVQAGTRLERVQRQRLHRVRGSWSIALFFAMQSMGFYSCLTWLPSILQAHGYSESAAGGLLALSNAVQFAPAFLVPVLAGRRRTQTSLFLVVCITPALSLLGLLAWPGGAALWMATLGLAQGGSLGLALILPVLRGATGPAVAGLTSMTLGVGYTIAAVGPFIAGLAHDVTGGWTVPLLLLVAMYASELLVSIPATRDWRAGEI
jgi:CP family cyanate transporter-like MFS transporter